MTEEAKGARVGDVERIPVCDLDDPRSRLELIRHVAAMVNAGGGTIVIGARRNGQVVGLTSSAAARFEAGPLADIVGGYLRPDKPELTVTVTDHPPDRHVVEIQVRGHGQPPVVLAQAGVFHQRPTGGSGGGSAETQGPAVEVFAANQVVVRRNGRTETARRNDYVRWRSEAVDDLRRELHERLALVVEAPPGATVRVVTDGEVLDEPSYFLARSTELFRLQPEQLLSSRDLVYLWLHRRTLTFDDDATRLIVHSALRKRATLYLWLTVLPVSDEQIRRYLFEAVTMRDRDKSDAARSVLLVCGLYLDAASYDALAEELRASSYAHMREAVEVLPDIEHARSQLQGERLISSGQEQLLSAADAELLDEADRLLAGDGPPPRRVPSFGMELLSRKLERRHQDTPDPTPNDQPETTADR